MNVEAEQLISRLGLAALPREGGFFARTWTSSKNRADGRPCGSAIFFLMTKGDFSALHRLGMDEIWHFHAGDPSELTLLDPIEGSIRTMVMGPDVLGDHIAQLVVPAGVWQGARFRLDSTGVRGWALFSCTVSPAWDEREFELGHREALLREFPAHSGIIRALTR
jgi:predicted cupin superfamily sugar epimerase